MALEQGEAGSSLSDAALIADFFRGLRTSDPVLREEAITQVLVELEEMATESREAFARRLPTVARLKDEWFVPRRVGAGWACGACGGVWRGSSGLCAHGAV